jgi:hypothetical protein
MSVVGSFGPGSQFTSRSETDSICMSCYRTVRADRYTSLRQAQREHSAVCQPLRRSSSDCAEGRKTCQVRLVLKA